MASASSFHRYTSSETIRVIVGEGDERVRHNLYIALLYDKSKFFRDKITELHDAHIQATNNPRPLKRHRARNGNANVNPNPNPNPFREDNRDSQAIFVSDSEPTPPVDLDGPDPIINLPQISPPAFRQFVQWLHDKPFDLTDLNLVTSTYLLGHTFESEEFRNDLIDAVRAHFAEAGTKRVDMTAMLKLSQALPPHEEANKGKNLLLELLVAQLTYKVLVRGWDSVSGAGYNTSKNVKALLDSSIEVVMWHLHWLHELNATRGRCGGKLKVKMKREGEGFDDKDGEGKDGMNVGRRRRTKMKDEPVNPATMAGCWFHAHLESKCKTPIVMEE